MTGVSATAADIVGRGAENPETDPKAAGQGKKMEEKPENVRETAACRPDNAKTAAQIDDLVKRFCFGNMKNIEITMLRMERAELEKLKSEVLEHVKRAEEKRDEFLRLKNEIDAERKLANEQVLKIFTEMKPEAAAQQLNTMDENKARAILGRLTPKVASSILNEMQPKKAALLAEGLLAEGAPAKPAASEK